MKLKHQKPSQDSDILVKVLKENANFLTEYLYIFFNKVTELSNFPSWLENDNITAVFKKLSQKSGREL